MAKFFSCETCRSSSADVIQTKPATDPICVPEVGSKTLNSEAKLLNKVTCVDFKFKTLVPTLVQEKQKKSRPSATFVIKYCLIHKQNLTR